MSDERPSQSLRPEWRTRPHPSRFDVDRPEYDACMAAHAAAVDAGQMGYMDPTTGLFVMTATHLAARDCCTRGCRHCPWVT